MANSTLLAFFTANGVKNDQKDFSDAVALRARKFHKELNDGNLSKNKESYLLCGSGPGLQNAITSLGKPFGATMPTEDCPHLIIWTAQTRDSANALFRDLCAVGNVSCWMVRSVYTD